MSTTLPCRALLAVTSSNVPFWPDGKKAGLFYTEGLHPYEALTAAGFEVHIASQTGITGLDEHSVEDQFLSDEDKKIYQNQQHPFNVALKNNMFKASDLDPSQYGLFLAAGGHGCIFDFPNALGLQSIAEDVYRRNGVVGAICHGSCILPGILDKNGHSIIEGRTVTGFTTEGEIQLNVLEKMNEEGFLTPEVATTRVGAKFVGPNQPFDRFSVVDGRIVTGTNPASAKEATERAVKLFDESKEQEIATA